MEVIVPPVNALLPLYVKPLPVTMKSRLAAWLMISNVVAGCWASGTIVPCPIATIELS